jgi:hypothetical protein
MPTIQEPLPPFAVADNVNAEWYRYRGFSCPAAARNRPFVAVKWGGSHREWWARQGLNLRPHPCESRFTVSIWTDMDE